MNQRIVTSALALAILQLLTPSLAQRGDTAEYLHGKVVINVIFVKTPSGYNWDQAGRDQVAARFFQHNNWLTSSAPGSVNLSFVTLDSPEVTVSTDPVSTQNGTIKPWMLEAIGQLGFASVRELNLASMAKENADRAYTYFMLNYVGTSQATTPGVDSVPAVTLYFYGVCAPWWPLFCVEQPYQTYVHESLHVFGATDEYSGSDACFGINCANPVHVPGNWYYDTWEYCAACNPQASIMNDLSLALTPATRGMIGWRDHDGDGVLDPLDYCMFDAAQAGDHCTGCPVIDCGHECDEPICDSRTLHPLCYVPYAYSFDQDYNPDWLATIGCSELV